MLHSISIVTPQLIRNRHAQPKALVSALWFCVSLSGCASLFHHPSPDEISIIQLRSLLNGAFAARDTAPLRRIYEPEYRRSTMAAILMSSADSSIRLWGDNFGRDPHLRVTWNPGRIGFRMDRGIAVETGTRYETQCRGGRLEHWTGPYLAQWQKSGRWELVHEAEGASRLVRDKAGSC